MSITRALITLPALLAVAAPAGAPAGEPVQAHAAPILPGRSSQYLPLLDTLLTEMWPELEIKSMIAAQIEQETCISRTSRSCWNPRTELKTSREYGFGLGQITIVYNEDGTVKSSTFEELKKLGGRLSAWKFENRFDPEMQLRAMILSEKLLYHRIRFETASEADKLAFMLSAYNGGVGGVLQDRRLCQPPGCDDTKWFGNVALNSRKAKRAVTGYRISFYDINRCYPRYILMDRRPTYAPYLSGRLDRFVDTASKAPARPDGTPNGEACAKALPETGLGTIQIPHLGLPGR